MATMAPYAMSFLCAGLTMVALWVALDLPLGPGAGVHYVLPTPAEAAAAPVVATPAAIPAK